jgi:hypothetical protein
LLEALVQFWSEYGRILLLVYGPILGVGLSGVLYIRRLNNNPPQNFSSQQAIQHHKAVDKWMDLILGPAVWSGAGGVLLLAIADISNERAGSLLVILFTSMVLSGTILSELGKQYLVYLRKRSAPTVEEILAGDQPPVLYLRSFIDDDTAEKLTSRGTTEEEEVSRAFQSLGPLIAIGQPGESLPDLGAARAYFEDDEWQAAVQDYMDIAGLVVLRAGFSRGLLWEIRNAVQRVKPERFVLLIPYTREDYDRFRKQVSEYFPKGLPDHSGHEEHHRWINKDGSKSTAKFGTLFGLIHFDADWTPHFEALQLKHVNVGYGKRVYKMIQDALRPVCQKLDRTQQWNPQGKSLQQTIMSVGCIVLGLVAACLLVGILY